MNKRFCRHVISASCSRVLHSTSYKKFKNLNDPFPKKGILVLSDLHETKRELVSFIIEEVENVNLFEL